MPSVTAETIDTILERSGFPRISILRMNIGGAEAAVFGSNCESWIGKVDRLAIELHGEECRAAFHNALSGGTYDTSSHEQVILATRRR
jgi:hypothetical protein